MYFLIDFENVKNAGMQGTEYLLPSDHVLVFYSDATPSMEKRHLEAIQRSECDFEICRLVTARKNALDFYMASRLGEVFGTGYTGSAVLITKDGGFQSIQEYWTKCAAPARRVFVEKSIERGITAAKEPDERTKQLREQVKPQDIGNFFAAYQEARKLRKLLEDTFAATEYASRTGEMEAILRNGDSARVIYLDTLRRFGRKDGLAVYRRLKDCAKP